MTTKDSLLQKSIPFISEVSNERGATWSSAQASYFLGAVLACFLLTLAIQYGNGYYNHVSIKLLSGSVILSILLIPTLLLTQATPTGVKVPTYFSTPVLLLFTNILLIFELILGLQDNYLHYNQNPLFPNFARGMYWLITLLVATYLLELFTQPGWPRKLTGFKKYRFVFILLLVVILKIATVLSSYRHINDVDIIMQESTAHFLSGHNPYTTATAGFAGFTYPPLNLLLPLPFYLLFGDTRFGSIIWELVGIGFIYQLARTELKSLPWLARLAELVILIFFLQPRGLFIIEQSCAEPLMVGVMAACFYTHYYKPTGFLADILLAATLAVKQYLLFMSLPLFVLYRFNWKRYAITAFTFVLIILPFILWEPMAFYHRTVLHFFQLPIQTTSLGLTAYFSEQGIFIPRWVSPIAAGTVAFGLGFCLKRFEMLGYLHTLILTFFCLFIFGQQAFANYYYLISFLQMLVLVFFLLQSFAQPNNLLAADA